MAQLPTPLMVVGLSKTWDMWLSTTLGGIRAVPSLAWVPLLIIWMPSSTRRST